MTAQNLLIQHARSRDERTSLEIDADRNAQKVLLALASPDGRPLEERIAEINALMDHFHRRGNPSRWPEEFWDAFQRDYALKAAKLRAAAAEGGPDSSQRARLLRKANYFENMLKMGLDSRRAGAR